MRGVSPRWVEVEIRSVPNLTSEVADLAIRAWQRGAAFAAYKQAKPALNIFDSSKGIF